MEEFNGFNMGQVFLGGMIGIVVGLVGGMIMIMAYNSLL
jgi:tetrahydromethanopterin S-methyltransferase subunit G